MRILKRWNKAIQIVSTQIQKNRALQVALKKLLSKALSSLNQIWIALVFSLTIESLSDFMQVARMCYGHLWPSRSRSENFWRYAKTHATLNLRISLEILLCKIVSKQKFRRKKASGCVTMSFFRVVDYFSKK